MTKTQQFRQLLQSDRTEFLMEAHSGLSAKIVEEAGFKGIWASGLSISAALGVRDNNEASWTQVLEVCEFMSDATTIPILLDGDTGYGNFNNMRRLVHKLEQRGVAAVCIEDKLFPKTNSFIESEQQPLADVDEFAGKIKAAKDGQSDPDFSVVARLEAFIAGWGLDEMLWRADAYYEAGADALLIHSKKSTPEQIIAFAHAWNQRPVDQRCPLVIVPTTYYSTPVQTFEEAGIKIVIWANHNVRASIRAMQETSRQIFQEQSLIRVEDRVVPVKEVFRLQNADELLAAEERYLPRRGESLRAIVVAAARGSDLRDLTQAKPKTMVSVNGRPILHRLIEHFRRERVKDIVVVRGFAKDEVHAPDVTFVDNDAFETTGELYTLSLAQKLLEGELIISYGDIIFRKYILTNLLAEEDDIVLAVDAAWQQRPNFNGLEDFVSTSQPYSRTYGEDEVFLTRMDTKLPVHTINGEWIGLCKTSAKGTAIVKAAIEEMQQREDFRALQLYDLFNHIVSQNHPVRVMFITGHWVDVDNLHDLARAQAF
ncbi:MAG: phosphoenolpyruvate mutase [Candidatus Hydrogenedentes bacterium]|nr:phosphoenolpyruvate mutase [Candidatus Hydrogenedentota bacterium]